MSFVSDSGVLNSQELQLHLPSKKLWSNRMARSKCPPVPFRFLHSWVRRRSCMWPITSSMVADQKSAVRFGDGEWIAAIPVAGQKVAFEIHTPKLIEYSNHRERQSADERRTSSPASSCKIYFRFCRRL